MHTVQTDLIRLSKTRKPGQRLEAKTVMFDLKAELTIFFAILYAVI